VFSASNFRFGAGRTENGSTNRVKRGICQKSSR